MSFLSALKSFGQKVNTASTVIPVYGQLAQAVVALTPGDKDDKAVAAGLAIANDGLVQAQNIIMNAEVMGQAISVPGAQKAAMAAPALQQLLMSLPILQGKKPKDPVVAMQKATAVGAALADYINQYGD
jgi:hypothetical protein